MFVGWRIGLWLVAAVGLWYNRALYPYGKLLSWNGILMDRNDLAWRALFQSWSIWDGDYYRQIALRGYTFDTVEWPSITFFPLYPLLIRIALPVFGGNDVIASVVISNVALLLALLLLHRVLRADFGGAIANRAILLLLLFPTSFFLAGSYSESLALALAVALLWALRGGRWWLAGAAGFLMALTRLPGVLAAPIILLAYLHQHDWRWRAIRWDALAAALPPAGLGLFMLYQWRRFGTPLAFLIAQEHWEQRLSPPWVMPQILVTRLWSEGLAIFGLHLGVWGLFIGLAVFAWRRLPWLYGLLLLPLLPAYMASWPFSIGRHVLIGFPAFVALALWTERPLARRLTIAVMLPLLLLCVLLFVNTFWVA